MDIKNRLKRIITTEGLNSAAFADIIGVQRSSISHIVSGRNKPSLDFLQKILLNFPKYSAEWLIMGSGEMLKNDTQTSLFNDSQNIIKDNSLNAEITNVNQQKETDSLNKSVGNSDIKQKTIINEEDIPDYGTVKSSIQPGIDKHKDKKVEKIVIFYSDMTFSEYFPSV